METNFANKNDKNWHLLYDRIIGDFFWSLLYRFAGTEDIDEWFTQVKPEMFELVREYFLSFGWDFMIEFAREEKQVDVLFYPLLPSELNENKDYLTFDDDVD